MAQRARRRGGVPGGVPPRDTPPDQGAETRPAGGDAGGESAAPVPGTVPSAAQQGEGALPGRCRGFADILQVNSMSIGLELVVFPRGKGKGMSFVSPPSTGTLCVVVAVWEKVRQRQGCFCRTQRFAIARNVRGVGMIYLGLADDARLMWTLWSLLPHPTVLVWKGSCCPLRSKIWQFVAG